MCLLQNFPIFTWCLLRLSSWGTHYSLVVLELVNILIDLFSKKGLNQINIFHKKARSTSPCSLMESTVQVPCQAPQNTGLEIAVGWFCLGNLSV